MVDEKYTKGEWKVTKHPPLDNLVIVVGGEIAYEQDTICRLEYTENMVANANLIASAPDLYEALIGLLEAYDVNLPAEECDYPDYWVKALQARAKAEGK